MATIRLCLYGSSDIRCYSGQARLGKGMVHLCKIMMFSWGLAACSQKQAAYSCGCSCVRIALVLLTWPE